MIALSTYSEFAGITKPFAICLAMLAASVAQAQESSYKFELTPFAGVTTGGDFDDMGGTASLALDDSSSFGLILNIEESANTQWEVLYSLQATEADTTGLPISGAPLDMDVHYIQGGGTYLFDGDAARPFLAATVGASHFAPGLSGVDSETFFAFSIGTGLQIRPSARFGVRLEARAYGTLVDSTSDLFCQSGPSGAICAVTVDGTILWQFQAFAGFVFRF
jgi:Outer membrane protein beta-barrel domain